MLRQVRSPHVLQVHDMERFRNGVVLVLEDFGASTLEEYLASAGPVGVERLLEIAVALSDGVAAIRSLWTMLCAWGIAPENVTTIFNHGFATRKDGHGFGLHSCALAAMEMAGALTVHSDGPGRGGTFTFELPVKRQRGVQI